MWCNYFIGWLHIHLILSTIHYNTSLINEYYDHIQFLALWLWLIMLFLVKYWIHKSEHHGKEKKKQEVDDSKDDEKKVESVASWKMARIPKYDPCINQFDRYFDQLDYDLILQSVLDKNKNDVAAAMADDVLCHGMLSVALRLGLSSNNLMQYLSDQTRISLAHSNISSMIRHNKQQKNNNNMMDQDDEKTKPRIPTPTNNNDSNSPSYQRSDVISSNNNNNTNNNNDDIKTDTNTHNESGLIKENKKLKNVQNEESKLELSTSMQSKINNDNKTIQTRKGNGVSYELFKSQLENFMNYQKESVGKFHKLLTKQQMVFDNYLIITIKYNEEYIQWNYQQNNPSLISLQQFILNTFKINNFVLKYMDKQQKQIEIDDDNDLQEAFKYAHFSNNHKLEIIITPYIATDLPLHQFTAKDICKTIKQWVYNDINHKKIVLETQKIFTRRSLKFVGKTGYKAPKVYCKKKIFDARAADVWSLGIELFMMVIGAPPFKREPPIKKNEAVNVLKVHHGLIQQFPRYFNQPLSTTTSFKEQLMKFLNYHKAEYSVNP